MLTYTACFRTDAQWASFAFEADTPEQALQMARDLWMGDSGRLHFQDYDMEMPVNEIAVSGPEGSELAVWYDDDMRLRLAAPQLLKSLELDFGHFDARLQQARQDGLVYALNFAVSARGADPAKFK